jgi:hypothetical protein
MLKVSDSTSRRRLFKAAAAISFAGRAGRDRRHLDPGRRSDVMYYGAEAEGTLGDDLVASLLADTERLIRGASS